MKTRHIVIVAVLLAAFSATSAFATFAMPALTTGYYNTSVPGNNGSVYDQAYAAIPANWTQVATMTSSIWDALDSQTLGNLTSWVYKDTSNGNKLVFAYQWNITKSGIFVDRATLNGTWVGSVNILDGGTVSDAGSSTASPGATHWTDGKPYFLATGANATVPLTVEWEFSNNGTELWAGNTSAIVYFATDLLSYGVSTATTQDGVVGTSQILDPVPEPGMFARAGLLGMGLLGFWGYRRNKK
jgi:hypothetical protein